MNLQGTSPLAHVIKNDNRPISGLEYQTGGEISKPYSPESVGVGVCVAWCSSSVPFNRNVLLRQTGNAGEHTLPGHIFGGSCT